MEALKGSWEFLSTEFPPILYGFFMFDAERAKNCTQKIGNYIKFLEEKQVPILCKDPLLSLESPESYAFYAQIYMTRNKKKIEYLM